MTAYVHKAPVGHREVEPTGTIRSQLPQVPIKNFGPDWLISAGFLDSHIHFPQTPMIAAFGEQLLDWLNKYTFPSERKCAEKDHIKVRMRLDDGLPTVIGSEVQLRQVVLNLVMNARDAMRSAPLPRELLIESERIAPDQVQVSINDSGPGISATDLERIFEPMFTTKSHGMGMGLSICRSIVEAHKGRIWAAGGSGTGSTFRFSLPAKEAPTDAA